MVKLAAVRRDEVIDYLEHFNLRCKKKQKLSVDGSTERSQIAQRRRVEGIASVISQKSLSPPTAVCLDGS